MKFQSSGLKDFFYKFDRMDNKLVCITRLSTE